MVRIGDFFFLDLETTEKLEFTVWFDVNPTFGCGEIRLLKPGGPFGPHPRLNRVTDFLNMLMMIMHLWEWEVCGHA